MPFTPTHVAAVLPIAALKRGALPFSALAIGSMVPDLPLFLPLVPDYHTTHSLVGVFTACLPLGLACFLAFQYVLKQPLFALLPVVIQRRCASLSKPSIAPSPQFVARVALAIVSGALTHLIWDSFTHRGRAGTLLFPWLNRTALTVWGHAVPGAQVLQYGSSVVGLPGLAILLAIWLSRRAPESLDGVLSLSAAAKITAYIVATVIPASAAALVWQRGGGTRYALAGPAVMPAGLALIVATVAYSLVYHAIVKRRTRAK